MKSESVADIAPEQAADIIGIRSQLTPNAIRLGLGGADHRAEPRQDQHLVRRPP
jgi:hypothetical protein